MAARRYLVPVVAWVTALVVTPAFEPPGLALGLGAINVKDAFWLGRGPTLAIPEGAKPGIHDKDALRGDGRAAR